MTEPITIGRYCFFLSAVRSIAEHRHWLSYLFGAKRFPNYFQVKLVTGQVLRMTAEEKDALDLEFHKLKLTMHVYGIFKQATGR